MTQLEYAAFLARRRGRPAAADGDGAVQDESELHAAIAAECLRRGWLALRGSMAHRAHRTVGEPDFIILREGGRWLAVEAKTRTGKLSQEQAVLHAWAARLGHEIRTVRSLGEFLEILEN